MWLMPNWHKISWILSNLPVSWAPPLETKLEGTIPSFPLILTRHQDGSDAVNLIRARGHSTTTWKKFQPILTPHNPQVNKNGAFYILSTLYHVTPVDFLLTPNPSSCPRSYWMPLKLGYQARTYLQLPLRQWGAGNVYLLVLSSWKVNIAENPIAVMGL